MKELPEATLITIHESDFQTLPSAAVSCIRRLPDAPKLAKPVPEIVTETEPVLGALVFSEDIFGGLNDTEADSLDRGVSTALEITASKERPAPRTSLLLMLESDFHTETAETLLPSTSCMLLEKDPMLAPTAVTELDPVETNRLAPMDESDGTSNECKLETLPKRVPIETTTSFIAINKLREILTDTEELDVHRIASVREDESAALGEYLISPNADPMIVSEAEPLAGTLHMPTNAAGAGLSNETRSLRDPD
jgi:hypothetical protein